MVGRMLAAIGDAGDRHSARVERDPRGRYRRELVERPGGPPPLGGRRQTTDALKRESRSDPAGEFDLGAHGSLIYYRRVIFPVQPDELRD